MALYLRHNLNIEPNSPFSTEATSLVCHVSLYCFLWTLSFVCAMISFRFVLCFHSRAQGKESRALLVLHLKVLFNIKPEHSANHETYKALNKHSTGGSSPLTLHTHAHQSHRQADNGIGQSFHPFSASASVSASISILPHFVTMPKSFQFRRVLCLWQHLSCTCI